MFIQTGSHPFYHMHYIVLTLHKLTELWLESSWDSVHCHSFEKAVPVLMSRKLILISSVILLVSSANSPFFSLRFLQAVIITLLSLCFPMINKLRSFSLLL